MNNVRRLLDVLLVTAALASGLPTLAATQPASGGPLVFAAASLTDVLQQVGADYTRERGAAVRFSFGSTATLARQVEQGAPADVFVAADEDWMDFLAQRSLIAPASRFNLLGNRLVLIAPAASPLQLTIAAGFKLREALGPTGRLAVADPASVPAGKYARAALLSLGVWNEVESRLAPADNVRTALLFVVRGEAPLGIVYRTDASTTPTVRVVAELPASSHPPIIYSAALTARASNGAAEFLQYLRGPAARRRFEAAGFTAPAATDADAPSARQ
jgi:molybdate transport system substrate-binding protein